MTEIRCDVPLPTEGKTCTKCGIFKSLNEFYLYNIHGNKTQRLSPSCKQCEKIRSREYAKKNPEKKKILNQNSYRIYHKQHKQYKEKRQKQLYTDVGLRMKKLIRDARERAKERNIPFSLTLDHVMKHIEYGKCSITGLPFQINKREGMRTNPYAPSLDQIEPNKGYTNENIRVVIWAYNAMKNEMSDFEVWTICYHVVKDAFIRPMQEAAE